MLTGAGAQGSPALAASPSAPKQVQHARLPLRRALLNSAVLAFSASRIDSSFARRSSDRADMVARSRSSPEQHGNASTATTTSRSLEEEKWGQNPTTRTNRGGGGSMHKPTKTRSVVQHEYIRIPH